MKSERILFFAAFPPPITGQTVATRLFHTMLSREHTVGVIDIQDPRRMERESGDFGLRHAGRIMVAVWKLWKRVQVRKPDVLYLVMSTSRLGHLRDLLSLAVARRHVGRVVAHVHSADIPELLAFAQQRRTLGWLAEKVDAFCFLSHTLARATLGLIPESKIFIVPNALEKEIRFDEEEVEERIQGRAGRTSMRVLFLGHMIPAKGYVHLAKALRELTEAPLPVEVDYVGGWPSEKARGEFEHRLRVWDVEGGVRIHGAVTDRSQVRDLLANADVLALPTEYHVEAQPIAIIEAMSAGIPIVSTRRGSIPEMVEEGVNGFLVEPQRPGEIAGALVKLMDFERWKEMARASRKVYATDFIPAQVELALKRAMGLVDLDA